MMTVCQVVLLVALLATIVATYSVVPLNGDILDPIDYDRDIGIMNSFKEDEIRYKRNTAQYGPFTKRNSLKRLVILSARGFGKRR